MELLNFKPPGLTGRHLPGCEVRFQSLRSREKENVDMVIIEYIETILKQNFDFYHQSCMVLYVQDLSLPNRPLVLKLYCVRPK